MYISMIFGKPEFFTLAASDTELVYSVITYNIVTTAYYAGMTKLCTKIIVS